MAYAKKKTHITERKGGIGFTKTATNRKTGQKTTTKKTATQINREDFGSGMAMAKTFAPRASDSKARMTRKKLEHI